MTTPPCRFRVPLVVPVMLALGFAGACQSSGDALGGAVADDAAQTAATDQVPPSSTVVAAVQSGDLGVATEDGLLVGAEQTESDGESEAVDAGDQPTGADGSAAGGEGLPFDGTVTFSIGPVPADADPATAVVLVVDELKPDTGSVEIARVQLSVEQLRATGTVEVFVPLPIDGSFNLAASALVDMDGDRARSSSDWASPEPVPIPPGVDVVAVELAQI